MQRRQRLPLEANEPVRIVLEHEQVVVGGEVDDTTTAILRERPPARVLEGREQIDETPAARRSRVQTRARRDRGLRRRSRARRSRRRARERIFSGRSYVGPLDEHAAPGSESLRKEDESLQRAVGEEDARRIDPVPFGSPFAQRPIAARRPVREDRRPVALERAARAVGELGHRQALRRGPAARERDRRCHAGNLAAC